MNDEGVEVVEKVDPRRLIEVALWRLQSARHPWQAATPLALLYTWLRDLRELDGAFSGEWDRILGGELRSALLNPLWRHRLSWEVILDGVEACWSLMQRWGMTMQTSVADEAEVAGEALWRFVADRSQASDEAGSRAENFGRGVESGGGGRG